MAPHGDQPHFALLLLSDLLNSHPGREHDFRLEGGLLASPKYVVGTNSAPKLIHKVLLCSCQSPGFSGLRGDKMCEAQAWTRGVHRSHGQEKRALRAQVVGGGGGLWGLGNWVREGFQKVGGL